MSWLRALKETARSGLKIERRRLEPLIAIRGAAGLALVIGVGLAFFGPVVAASSAFGAFQAAIATFQRSWRPRPVLALVSGVSLAVSTFLGYLTGSHVLLFMALLVLWTFVAGLAWAAGPTAGIIASSNVAIMLVTITLPTSVAEAALHGTVIAFGGVVQATLIVLFPVRRWGAQRDALADALAAEADYARRLRHDPVAEFDPVPLMTARSAAAVTPRQARRRPAELRGSAAWPNGSDRCSPHSPTRGWASRTKVPNGTGYANSWPPPDPYWTRRPARSATATRCGSPPPPSRP